MNFNFAAEEKREKRNFARECGKCGAFEVTNELARRAAKKKRKCFPMKEEIAWMGFAIKFLF